MTNPWFAGLTQDRDLPRDQLEERILNLFSTHNLAVIATVNKDGSPAATPVRYFSLGFEIFYTSWNASVKSRNLQRDPRVSAGIVAPLVGQASSRGAQLFGTARTLEREDQDAEQAALDVQRLINRLRTHPHLLPIGEDRSWPGDH